MTTGVANLPYRDDAVNHIYALIFADNVDVFRQNHGAPDAYPWNVLFSPAPSAADLQKVIDQTSESRLKILACNLLRAAGQLPAKRELLGVVVEVGLEGGLDVLAAFDDGTARYINQTGAMIIWETTDQQSTALINRLFQESINIVQKIGPWHEARRPRPAEGMVRLSFLVSDGLYFGEGPINVLFNDPMAAPALTAATQLMQYLTEKR